MVEEASSPKASEYSPEEPGESWGKDRDVANHYHYCGHLCMASKGEVNENDHVADKYPPQLIKNETLK